MSDADNRLGNRSHGYIALKFKEVSVMYYSSGNYEAFSHPKKPEGVDSKSAYIIGSGLAALTAACYLVRDGQMKGEHIHIF